MLLATRAQLGPFLTHLGLTGEGVEIGCGAGTFSRALLSGWPGRRLHMVDCFEHQPWETYPHAANHPDEVQRANREQAEASAAVFAGRAVVHRGYSIAVARTFADKSLDFVYLDANPSYRAVRADLRAWWPKLRPGGVLCGHDHDNGLRATSNGPVSVCTSRPAVEAFILGHHLFPIRNESGDTWWCVKPEAPRPPYRIAVTTAFHDTVGRPYAALFDIVRENHTRYCARHGYDYLAGEHAGIPGRAGQWLKIDCVKGHLESGRYDWVMWVDVDHLFALLSVPLTAFIRRGFAWCGGLWGRIADADRQVAYHNFSCGAFLASVDALPLLDHALANPCGLEWTPPHEEGALGRAAVALGLTGRVYAFPAKTLAPHSQRGFRPPSFAIHVSTGVGSAAVRRALLLDFEAMIRDGVAGRAEIWPAS